MVSLDHIAGISTKNGWNCWFLSQMGDLQTRIWKPRERVLVRCVSKLYHYGVESTLVDPGSQIL